MKFNKEFSEDDSEELVNAEIDGIKHINLALNKLSDESKVVLITIG